MTIKGRYTVALTEQIKDPAVRTELQRIQAAFLGLSDEPSRADAEAGLDTGQTVNTLPVADDGQLEQGLRWLTGPWLLGPDGNTKTKSVIRDTLTANQDNYAPLGIDTAIGIEIDATANHTISGIRRAKNQRRLLFIMNRSGFEITLTSGSDSASIPENQFDFGIGSTVGDPSLILSASQNSLVWLYYDASSQRWRLFAIPALPWQNLPDGVRPPDPSTAFPPQYGFFGSRCDGSSNTLAGIGEADTLTAAGTYRNSTVGIGKDFTTAAAPGAGTGVNTGGGAQVSPQHDPTWEVLIRTGGSIGNIRIWALLTNIVPTDADDIGGGGAYMGFRFSTVAADPGWMGATRDGAAQSITASAVAAIAINTIYRLKVRKSGTSVYFSVNGGAETALAANLPPATTQMFWAVRWFTQDAAGKTVSFYQHMVKFGVSF